MTHPDHVVTPDARDRLPLIEPVYRLTAGLPLRTVQNGVAAALAKAPDLAEWIDPSLQAAAVAGLETGAAGGARTAGRFRHSTDHGAAHAASL